MPELKERLERLAALGEHRGAEVLLDARRVLDESTTSRLGARHPRSRRGVIAATVTLGVLGVVGVVALALVLTREEHEPVVRTPPASSDRDLRGLWDTSNETPASAPLFLFPGDVPAGFEPLRIQGGDRPGQPTGAAGSTEWDRIQLWARFDAAGTRVTSSFTVQWGPGATAETAPGRAPSSDPLEGFRSQSVPIELRGHDDAVYSEDLHSVAWIDASGRAVAVGTYTGGGAMTRDELVRLTESLTDRADGGYDVGEPPPGYVQIAEQPGMASQGTNPREIVYGGPGGTGFRVYVVDDAETPPGQDLVPVPGMDSAPELVDVNGRSAVLTQHPWSSPGSVDQQTLFLRSADQYVEWLEPGNVLVSVSTVGLGADEALAIARGLRAVDRAAWDVFLVQAPGRAGAAPSGDASGELTDVQADAADAYLRWGRARTVDDVASSIEDGDALRATIVALQDTNAALYAREHEVTVGQVRLVDATHALVTFTIKVEGGPTLANQQGSAVSVGGRWLVSRATYCGLAAMSAVDCPRR